MRRERLHDFGVVGAKIDFFDHEHKEVVDLYSAMLAEAAKYQVMVNFHGANRPTGEPRTWPNELVREGVRGMESSRLKQRAKHDATLPFTRFLAGHADYTPVHFGTRRADTTWAHQIASAAVFTAPLLTYGAHPTSILSNPGVEMMKNIPAAWDETIVLPVSEIGEIAAFARRSAATRWRLISVRVGVSLHASRSNERSSRIGSAIGFGVPLPLLMDLRIECREDHKQMPYLPLKPRLRYVPHHHCRGGAGFRRSR